MVKSAKDRDEYDIHLLQDVQELYDKFISKLNALSTREGIYISRPTTNPSWEIRREFKNNRVRLIGKIS